MGSANTTDAEAAVAFQDQDTAKLDRLDKLRAMYHALGPHKDKPHTAAAFALVEDRLRTHQQASNAFRIVSAMGMVPDVDKAWSISLLVSDQASEPKARTGNYLALVITNTNRNNVTIEVNGPKGRETGNDQRGIIEGKGLGFRPIDVADLRAACDAIAQLYGIERLAWEHAAVAVDGLPKSAVKPIRKWLV